MARDKLTEYDATAANNTVVGDVNLAENSALPSDMNNAVREVMSHLKGFASGTDAIDALTVTGAATVGNGLTVDDDGATVLTVDRATSGGTIIDVQKDGSSVGTIAEKDGEITIGSGDVGLRFYAAGDAVIPVTSTNQEVRDNAIDLGGSSFRFNDAYLGGNLYIGGTGSANALDDYEEGGWVPSATSGITINNVRQATYTKVGRSVSAGFWINADITSTDFVIAGLPYTIFGRFGGSLSNQNLKETLAVTSITTSIYAYGATTGTDDEILFFLTYDT